MSLALLGHPIEMRCPRDNSELTVRETEGHIGFLCSSCGGAWLPSKYVQSIEHTRIFCYADFTAALARHSTGTATIPCPSRCEMLHEVRAPDATLEWCPRCRGVWFDRGEVARLVGQHRLREQSAGQTLAEHTIWSVLVDVIAGFN